MKKKNTTNFSGIYCCWNSMVSTAAGWHTHLDDTDTGHAVRLRPDLQHAGVRHQSTRVASSIRLRGARRLLHYARPIGVYGELRPHDEVAELAPLHRALKALEREVAPAANGLTTTRPTVPRRR